MMSSPAAVMVPVPEFENVSLKVNCRVLPDNLARSLCFRRRAVAILVDGVERDVPRVARSVDAHLEDGHSAQEFLVGKFTGPVRSVASSGEKSRSQQEESDETGSPVKRGRGKRAHEKL